MVFLPIRLSSSMGTLGSSIATFFFFWEIIRRYCPPGLARVIQQFVIRGKNYFYPYVHICVHEYVGTNLRPHDAYDAIKAYLSANSLKTAKRLQGEIVDSSSKFLYSMDDYEKVTDEFEGVQVWWYSGKAVLAPRLSSQNWPDIEKRYYRITFHKRYREMIAQSYMDHVIKEGREIRARNRRRKLYTNTSNARSLWSSIVFEHPSTFQTLAMDSAKKEEIIEDLLTFSQNKDYYSRIGKAHKRGYLLYGPPGTGKSTMIAAMANLLDYHVYDLELTAVKDNTELRRLLIETRSKSIIVIEDVDCSLDLTGRRKTKAEKSSEDNSEKGKKEVGGKDQKEDGGSKVTLSGLLNFIDGLWSSCSGERIIVFTTNYVDKLDPALTRRGRMDKHIELSYCSFEGFKVLAKNYLGIEEHPLYESVEESMKVSKITPADVAESLMPKSRKVDVEKCLWNLLEVLKQTKDEVNSRNAKEEPLKQTKDGVNSRDVKAESQEEKLLTEVGEPQEKKQTEEAL